MCQILLSMDIDNYATEFKKFYKTQNAQKMIHGFGIGHYDDNNSWKFTRKPISLFNADKDCENYIKIFEKKPKSIIVHLRQIYLTEPNVNLQSELKLENTHPFCHEDMWLVHRGNIFVKSGNAYTCTFQSGRETP